MGRKKGNDGMTAMEIMDQTMKRGVRLKEDSKDPFDEEDMLFIERECQEHDLIFQPPHYTQWKAIEPFTFLMLNDVPFAEGCVCKYVLRWRKKNGIEDLKKARRIIDMMIELEENRADYTPKRGTL